MLMLMLMLLLINPMLLLTLSVCYRSGYRSGSIQSPHPIVVGFAAALSLRRFAAVVVVVVATLLLLLIDSLLFLLLLLSISRTVAAVINQTELEL